MSFVNEYLMPRSTGSTASSDHTSDLSSLLIDLADPVPAPEPILRSWNTLTASRGNISTVVGLAKSKKSFLTAAIASGFLSGSDFLGFDTPAAGRVVYIDTEQSRAHVHRLTRRILRSIGLPTDHNHDQLVVAALRELPPDERRETTRCILERYRPELLIIDGIADLCNDTNDQRESEQLTCDLMRWSSEYNNHILCVLHTNPGGDKARGHLGSSLLRKSETVMLVKASGSVSVVTPQYCRNEPFAKFAFAIDDRGIPELCGVPGVSEEAQRPEEGLFATLLEPGRLYAHSELVELLMAHAQLKEGSAKSKIWRAVKRGDIVRNQTGSYYLPVPQVEPTQAALELSVATSWDGID